MGLVEQYENQIKPRLNYSQELSELSPTKKGDYWALVCPECEKKEAFIYENTGMIECNRKDKCGYKEDFLAYKNGDKYPN